MLHSAFSLRYHKITTASLVKTIVAVSKNPVSQLPLSHQVSMSHRTAIWQSRHQAQPSHRLRPCMTSSMTKLCVCVQLITELPFTGTGDTLEYANDYHITTCTGASSVADTVGSPVRLHTIMACVVFLCPTAADLHLPFDSAYLLKVRTL